MISAAGKPCAAVVAAALACLVATITAGCASSPSSPSSGTTRTPGFSPTAPADSTAPSARSTSTSPAACPTRSLRVSLGPGEGYAGGVYQVITFTNSSAASCTLDGYPGVSLVSGPSDAQIGLAAKRVATVPVTLVTLAPRATARAALQVVDAGNYPPSTCGPVKAASLRVYPPNQTEPVFLPSTAEGCAKPVQVLFVAAVQKDPAASPNG
ncbi:MAG: DUF4232 domain-containing protein [Streptosporangiaceae bacterium]|nr:DUF4232 domain-containing protein [Streptosporangiaceae bacterium]